MEYYLTDTDDYNAIVEQTSDKEQHKKAGFDEYLI